MSNIPRRKIYETLLEFEDSIIELRILILSQENFEKYIEKYKNSIKNMFKSYKQINSLLNMFLENDKYENESDFQSQLNRLLLNQDEVLVKLNSNKNLLNSFKKNTKLLNCEFEKNLEIKSIEQIKKFLSLVEKYHNEIPEILTLRRDKMK